MTAQTDPHGGMGVLKSLTCCYVTPAAVWKVVFDV